ncbi:unnamed protein product [Schistosoma curassoni]|uniref:Uncharacterized protein n=1 Tax=Schistosoma curassoni TaxID=6186 RepID=A0A183K269_9TREM|nr:unnamed protein product [Schistosoma curassoni]
MKLKLKKIWTQRFNTAFLRDNNKLNQFNITFNSGFQALQDLLKVEQSTMENNQKGIRAILTSTCQEAFGRNKHHHKEWIFMQTLNKIYSKPERPVKYKDGKLITEIEEQKNRWVEQFEKPLNIIAPLNQPDIKAASKNLPIDGG